VSWDGYGARGRSAWLDVDWSRHRRRVTVAGAEMELVDLGSGPAIVWIHGLGASWQSWLENLPHFAEGFRCIAMDLPGFGRSELPRSDVTISRYAQWVDELLDQLGVERAVVVGNSMGGFIGAELALRSSTRVEKLVLVSAAVLWQEYRRAKPLVALARVSDAAVGMALAKGTPRAAYRPRMRRVILRAAGFRAPQRLPGELQVELIRTAPRTRGFLPALQALASFPLRDELREIRCPTLIVWGRDDPLVGRHHAHELERLIPGSRKVVFDRTGHEPMLERPEAFNRLLDDFLSTPEVPAPRTPNVADVSL
jgi:pimeloyl-ACP methyl ester carboxylesterase